MYLFEVPVQSFRIFGSGDKSLLGSGNPVNAVRENSVGAVQWVLGA